MGDILSIIPAVMLLVFLIWNYKKKRAWQLRYDAVEQTATEIARRRVKTGDRFRSVTMVPG